MVGLVAGGDFSYVLTMSENADPVGFQRQFFRRNPNALSMMELMEFLPSVAFYAKDTESRFVKVNSVLLANKGFRTNARPWQDGPGLFSAGTGRGLHCRRQAGHGGAQGDPEPDVARAARAGHAALVCFEQDALIDPEGEVIGICGVMYPVDTPQDQERYFRELVSVIRYVNEHYAEPVSMKAMAELAGLSATHFNRRFRVLLRMSPTEYLLALRVQEAQRFLTESSMSMSEIALEAGFSDQSHFTKRFKRVTGLTPLAYRKGFRR